MAVPQVRRGDQQGQGGRPAGRAAEEAQGEGGDRQGSADEEAEGGHSDEESAQEVQLVQVFGRAEG